MAIGSYNGFWDFTSEIYSCCKYIVVVKYLVLYITENIRIFIPELLVSEWIEFSYYHMGQSMYQENFFKGCLSQILLGRFLNTLSHITNWCYYTEVL